MITVTLYVRNNHPASRQAQEDLNALQDVIAHQLAVIDVDSDPALQKTYGERVPVVKAGPYELTHPFDRAALQMTLGAARDRATALEKVGDTAYQQRVKAGKELTGTDRFSLWLSRHYLAMINLLVFLYVGLPFLAPVLMKVGAPFPAKVIYSMYSPLCHQFPFRSFFLFGEQPYYPRALAHMDGVLTYEQVTNNPNIDVFEARKFLGNDVLGYKVALCERDVAIYGSILLFGLLYAVTGRKLGKIPWYIWLFVGMGPIGLDGVSQLPGLAEGVFLKILPILRESTPLLRTITGGLFGFLTAWYLFPIIEESMLETRRTILRKISVISQTTTKVP